MSKRNKILVYIGMLTLLVISCSKGLELNQTQRQGKRIYEALCNKCHKLIEPSKHTDAEWNAAVEKYGGQLKLGGEELASLKAYLTFVNQDGK